MFTGIIEELGELVEVVDLGSAARYRVRGPLVTSDARPGDSIAVSGVCLTVVEVRDGAFTADVMKETLDRSSLSVLAPGDPVNLERAATLTTRLGGHLVQGHVDGTAVLLTRRPDEHWEVVRFSLPAHLARYVVEKGSITVDGVSLTVSGVGVDAAPGRSGLNSAPGRSGVNSAPGRSGLNWFEVSLIPTTLGLTTLGKKDVGAPANLEVDVIAKYTEKLLGAQATGRDSGEAERA